MTNEEFASTVATLLEARPFRKFTVMMNDGAQLEIDVLLSLAYRDGTFVFTAKGRGPRIFKCANVRQIVPAAVEKTAA